MLENDPPVAADDFPEFAEPPRHKPAPSQHAREEPEPEVNEAQAAADDLIARLRKKRAEGQQ